MQSAGRQLEKGNNYNEITGMLQSDFWKHIQMEVYKKNLAFNKTLVSNQRAYQGVGNSCGVLRFSDKKKKESELQVDRKFK